MRIFFNILLFFSILSSNEFIISDGFESGNFDLLQWGSNGDASWQVDTLLSFDGLYSAHSDTTITHNQSSILTLIADAGCGSESQISFYRKVISEIINNLIITLDNYIH